MSIDWEIPEDFIEVAKSGVFDAQWYISQNSLDSPDYLDALEHFMEIGWKNGLDPSIHFNTNFYLDTNKDVYLANVNPLVHYLKFGWAEGRLPTFGFVAPKQASLIPNTNPLTVKIALEISFRTSAAGQNSSRSFNLPSLHERAEKPEISEPPIQPIRTVAFYLPQYHRIKENDEWWGANFTDWVNVRRGEPQFRGHYQPHIPAELGYYDLTDSQVMKRQIDLAQNHGVNAFCFYVYWFGGKRLLEKPVDLFVSNPELKQDFVVCWANENWTRAWDGSESSVLISQNHSDADDIDFIESMAPYLRDPRYMRVKGHPLLLVYRPGLLPDPVATANRWRQWCRSNGVGEIALGYVQSFHDGDPSNFGFDYAIEFPPGTIKLPNITDRAGVDEQHKGNVYDWTALVKRSEEYSNPGYSLFRGACPSWDNSVRRPFGGEVLVGSTPDLFRQWLINAGYDTVARFSDPSERIVFINAWNEWAEGCHLEPDEKYGYQWLHAVRDMQTIIGLSS
jgi:hypothetical protein